ncbi:TMEM175 family protein [Terriglobus roseus]|uniref:Uncharacterized membrane protein n=1 Tax=Terriglobus roseus TaxID=392734 RepID=A0A1G7NZT2_9BACT|nr:TMEM175 family protein [Terriglobus roseus]SDF78869.1 Uncharacterized membrane protein [Terriglobus roseus]
MTTVRLEAFSDAVIAIIITIMVLELKVPHGTHIQDLAPLLPVFLSYIVSFLYVGIYWNNHHHLLKTCKEITGSILWANLHLLFWLSLFPFAAGWLGENHFSSLPTALYACVLLMAGFAYYLLQQAIMQAQGQNSVLKRAIGKDRKSKLSLVLYVLALFATLRAAGIAQAILVIAGLIWLVPDRRIAKGLAEAHVD